MSENEVLFIRSSKKNQNRSSGDSSTNDEDIWDDTILIETYDKAVQLAQQSLKKKNSNENISKVKKKENDSQKWKAGDKCRCQYSEDMKYYEAEVIEILGSGMCCVRYVGYENEENVPIKRLKPSEGDEARFRQMQQALNENAQKNNVDLEETASQSGNKTKPFGKKLNKKKVSGRDKHSSFENGGFSPFNFPFSGNAIIPPPPPPHMFNDLGEDESETDAMSAMLISWYMSGYHTGYYQGLKMGKKQQQTTL